MPFDPAPVPKVGQFQKYADAIMAGCQQSPVQCKGEFFDDGAACALGAMALGLGFNSYDEEYNDQAGLHVENFLPDSVCNAYSARYGCSIPQDNDVNGFTREQIAARIAAL